MQLKSKDLLGMQQLDKEEIELILNTAQGMKQALLIGHKKTTHLQGKSVVTLFYENSTRTRLSLKWQPSIWCSNWQYCGQRQQHQQR